MTVAALASRPATTDDGAGAASQPPRQTHTVGRGETLSTIARDWQVSTQALQAANPQVLNPDVIYPGQVLNLPEGAVQQAQAFVSPTGPTPVLEQGDRGATVRELQDGLRAAGFDPGTTDGIFGARTDAAVRAFQGDRGLGVDGVVGPRTWEALGRTGPGETTPVIPGEVPSTGDAASDRRIAGLHPEVQATAAQFINQVREQTGIQLRLTQGTRTYAEQDALYAQGRTTPGAIVTNARGGYSYHNFGVAFDVVELRPDGSVNWDTDWAAIGAVGESMGLEWGGNWTGFQDRPHFQMDFGLSTAQLRQRVADGDVGPGGFARVN